LLPYSEDVSLSNHTGGHLLLLESIGLINNSVQDQGFNVDLNLKNCDRHHSLSVYTFPVAKVIYSQQERERHGKKTKQMTYYEVWANLE
jgi:hypothetical protein